MVAAQTLVGADELEDLRGQCVERGGLAVHHVAVEVGRSANRLTGVVDDDVEPPPCGEHVSTERLDARRVPEVEPEDLQTVTPVGEVGLGGVPRGGVAREAGRHDQRSPATQQLDPGLVPDLHAPAGEQRNRPREIGQFSRAWRS